MRMCKSPQEVARKLGLASGKFFSLPLYFQVRLTGRKSDDRMNRMKYFVNSLNTDQLSCLFNIQTYKNERKWETNGNMERKVNLNGMDTRME